MARSLDENRVVAVSRERFRHDEAGGNARLEIMRRGYKSIVLYAHKCLM